MSTEDQKKKIMIFCDSYLPSYTSGGGMWTLVNLIERFADRYDFYVVTRNYDLKGDKNPYRNVRTNEWNKLDNAKVFYFSKSNLTERKLVQLISDIRPQGIFLNSCLATPTIKLLSARRKGMIDDLPVVLAPCGEMTKGSLSVKPYKKKLFLAYAKLAALYRGVIWKASSEVEEKEIRSVIGDDIEVFVAPDLTPRAILSDYVPESKPHKNAGSVRFVFLSRITRVKNIVYLLDLLRDVKTGKVILEIIGPIEDKAYWKECLAVIEKLPPNIEVKAIGPVKNNEALRMLTESHFCVLPTLDENFGFVFIEALAAGCPLLVSDRNIWTGIEKNKAGWRIPLDRPETWLDRINECINMSTDEYRQMSENAREYSSELLIQTAAELANELVLQRAVNNQTRVLGNA